MVSKKFWPHWIPHINQPLLSNFLQSPNKSFITAWPPSWILPWCYQSNINSISTSYWLWFQRQILTLISCWFNIEKLTWPNVGFGNMAHVKQRHQLKLDEIGLNIEVGFCACWGVVHTYKMLNITVYCCLILTVMFRHSGRDTWIVLSLELTFGWPGMTSEGHKLLELIYWQMVAQ